QWRCRAAPGHNFVPFFAVTLATVYCIAARQRALVFLIDIPLGLRFVVILLENSMRSRYAQYNVRFSSF
ncbi:MAG TPA: hypothetical protein VN229_24595, partial [Terriglobales bacterium]|nr:hypothetical protein [Terriglobales bacterium]